MQGLLVPPEARRALFGSIRSGLDELNSSQRASRSSNTAKRRLIMPKFRDVLKDVLKLQQSDEAVNVYTD